MSTGVDLPKILGGQTKIRGQKMVKSDKCTGVFQILGARARAAFPKSTLILMSTLQEFLASNNYPSGYQAIYCDAGY